MQSRGSIRKICPIRFPNIQNNARQRKSTYGNPRDKIITLYHASLFAGHQGVIKTYLTISDKFFIPNLMHYLRSFLKACHVCQLARNDKPPTRQLETRINLNYKPMSRLSMDLKVMPRLQKGHRYILCIIDEVTNYLTTAPLYQAR